MALDKHNHSEITWHCKLPTLRMELSRNTFDFSKIKYKIDDRVRFNLNKRKEHLKFSVDATRTTLRFCRATVERVRKTNVL